MDPMHIAIIITVAILAAAAGFGIYTRKKGAPMPKIDPVKRAERQAKRKERRAEIVAGVKAGLGKLDDEEREAIQKEILEAGQALVRLATGIANKQVDPKDALRAAQEIADVVREVREGLED